jgi:hypothetical protein
MKHLLAFTILLIALIGINSSTIAQTAQGNVVIVQKLEAAFSPESRISEFDSLTALYNENVWDKNPYVISHKTIRHWWGSNNRDIIEITEVASWDDILKANEKNEELFNETWTTEEDRKAFWSAYDKYFTGQHSDEIYREIVSTKSLTQN